MVARPCSAVRSPVTVERREGGAGVGGLVAERAVQFGGVADGLVDGQPQVGRVDDEVVQARLDAGRTHLLGEQLRQLLQLALPVPAGAGEVLPAASDRRCDRPHRVELAARLVDRHGRQLRVQPYALLGGHRPGGVGVELVLVHGEQGGVHMVHAARREQPGAPVRQQRRLLLVGHGERIDLVRRDPRLVRVHRLVGELHALVRTGRLDHLGGQLGHRHRLRGDLGGGVEAQVHTRGEAPGAAVHDPYRVPEVGGVRRTGGLGVAEPPGGVAHPLEPEVRVLGAQRTRACQRRVGQGA
jgi:hypothetical protein